MSRVVKYGWFQQEEGYAKSTGSETVEVILLVLHRLYGYALGGCLAAEGKMAGRITWRALGLVCRTRYISFRTIEFISFWGLKRVL